jgi:hypothetical protein
VKRYLDLSAVTLREQKVVGTARSQSVSARPIDDRSQGGSRAGSTMFGLRRSLTTTSEGFDVSDPGG